MLVDWGLAEFINRNRSYTVKVATNNYKPPELLLNNSCYDFTVDSWGAGCVLGALMFKEFPIFHGNKNSILHSILLFYG